MKQQKNPSRKLSILTAVFILLFGVFIGGYLVLKSGKISAGELKDTLKGQSIDLSLCQPNTDDSTRDSDNDGLKDWQEIQLYKTDPCKQDSDGDGYLDGEEVASGYDPAKKAPGDELPGTISKTPRPLPNNLTVALQQKLSEQLRQDRISPLDTNGNLLSSQEMEQFPGIQQAVWEITQHQNQLFAPESIDENQIKTDGNNSESAIRSYAAKTSKIIAVDKKTRTHRNEISLILYSIQNNDFSEMQQRLNSYQNDYENLKLAIVPSDLLPLHLELMNIFSSQKKIYSAIMELDSDPLKTTLAIQAYQVNVEKIKNWAEELVSITKNH